MTSQLVHPKLTRDFFDRPTLKVARDLIGLRLVRVHRGQRMVGRIVETEAYQGPQDLAAHSSRGLTPRTATMFGPPGHAYIYLIYGFWHCLNFVTRAEGIPHAVLIRGIEPVAHISDKTWGPGLLCRALNIDRKLNGADLLGDVLWVEQPADIPKRRLRVARAPRIGVDYAKEWALKPWRFFDRDSPYVSTLTAAQRTKLLARIR